MVKSVNFLDELIFNYLEKDNSAILLAHTGFFMDRELNDGILWVQYNENKNITAVISGDNESCIVFASKNADFEELNFLLHGEIITPDNLPFQQIDKKYLMHKRLKNVTGDKGIKYTKYGKIEGINDKLTREHTEVKKFLHLFGNCEGAVIEEKLQTISGGFICFNKDLAVISDVFTKEKYRNRGYGKRLVNKLLSLSPVEDVYLISKDFNVSFYEKLGFTKAKEIYLYKGK